MAICCDKIRLGKYCPNCGRSLVGNSPLHGLLSHCQVAIAAIKKSARSRLEKAGTDESDVITSQLNRSIEKWQLWESELAKLLNETSPINNQKVQQCHEAANE